MKENITINDVNNLYEEFKQYCETAEQHEFPLLIKLNIKLLESIKNFNNISNKDKNAMFRVIYKIIGKNYSDYV